MTICETSDLDNTSGIAETQTDQKKLNSKFDNNISTLRSLGVGIKDITALKVKEITATSFTIVKLNGLISLNRFIPTTPITGNLPLSTNVNDGDNFILVNQAADPVTNTVTISVNGNTLDGSSSDIVLDTNNPLWIKYDGSGEFTTLFNDKRVIDAILALDNTYTGDNTFTGTNIFNDVGIGGITPLTPLHIKGTQIASFTGTTRGHMTLSGSYSTDYFTCIDAIYNDSDVPSSRIGFQHTALGSLIHFGLTTTYTGINKNPLSIASDGIKVADYVIFTTNNTGAIGSALVAPSDVYGVNAFNATSDERYKKIISRSVPLGLDFVCAVAENALLTHIWEDTIIPENKISELKKVTKINPETGKEEIDYEFQEFISQERQVITHSRQRWSFSGQGLFKLLPQFNLTTKEAGFLSIAEIDENGNSTFDSKGNPLLDNEGLPIGKITLKNAEIGSPVEFNAINELKKIVDELKENLKNAEKRIKALEGKK